MLGHYHEVEPLRARRFDDIRERARAVPAERCVDVYDADVFAEVRVRVFDAARVDRRERIMQRVELMAAIDERKL